MDKLLEPNINCPGCNIAVHIPYIRCVDCHDSNVIICLHCFAKGVEFGQHQNNHAYSVVKYKFPVYEEGWSAMEEMKLLEAVENYGYGNWSDIATQLPGKTVLDCERHYNCCYIVQPHPPLPEFPQSKLEFFPAPVLFKLSSDPPRPREGTPLYMEMAGYCAPRGEFAVEHNNFAEMNISHLTLGEDDKDEYEEDAELINEAKQTLVYSYWQKLRERHRRKRIVKEYGLINWFKMIRLYHSGMEQELRQIISGLQVFTTLMTPMNNDKLMEALRYEHELKNQICCLQEYRLNGLKRMATISMYCTLRSRRSISKTRRHLLTDVVNHIRDDAAVQSWLQRHVTATENKKIFTLPSAPRKAAPPLQIEGYEGYERLTASERELCQSVRLLPGSYLEFRKVLVNECRKSCGLKLAQARTLIKIDVNKTRKLYDFLLNEGQITKPS